MVKGKYLICLIFSLLILSCSSPQRVAKEFLHKKELLPILYISNSAIYTEFYRPSEILDTLNYYKPEVLSSMLDDTLAGIMMNLYDEVFVDALRMYDFQVFTADSIAAFFSESRPAWQLSLVQTSIEEHRMWFEDEITFTDYSVIWDTVISQFQYNTWFELTPVNADSAIPTHLFFASVSVSDNINGRFVYDWGARVYSYVYDFYPVDVGDLFTLVASAAMTHGSYLFDFFLNRYVYFNCKKSEKMKFYFTYDIRKRKLLPAKENRFIFL